MGKVLGLKLVLLFMIPGAVMGQEKYWILNAEASKSLLDSLRIPPLFCSDWLSVCSYTVSETDFHFLKSLGIELLPVQAYAPTGVPDLEPTFALEQIQARAFTENGLTGKGMKIGIIDGGFLNANQSPALSHFFKENKVVFYQDYITPEMEPYAGVHRLDDSHGTEVWQMIGGYDPNKKIQFGMATEATYYLARTDHGAYEKRIEEDYLIAAIEQMEKLGVKLVNISLGYNLGFTDASENYLPEQMDGKTAMLTKAVEMAALEKGLLIVVAAGNDGADKWRIISTPADAEHALVVGATKFDLWDKMDYSSIGAEFVSYMKPDVAVFSTQGTSFSAPVITGLAACIWQYDSTLTNFEVMDLIRESGNFFPYGNNYVGFGVPNCPLLLHRLETREPAKSKVEVIHPAGNKIRLSGPFINQTLIAYHKKDSWKVAYRNQWRPVKNTIKVERPEGISQTSILAGKQVFEIIWKPKL